MNDVRIVVSGAIVALRAPYDEGFPPKARKIGGKFNRADQAWTFDARDEARVRELAINTWGTDGSDPDGPTVTVRVPLTKSTAGFREPEHSEYRLAGRRLCRRAGRDEDVWLADGVTVVAGEFESSGGSMRYPSLGNTSGVVLQLRDVPVSVAEKMREEQADVEILRKGGRLTREDVRASLARQEPVDQATLDRRALEEERAELIERIAEIDRELASREEKA